jgi:hypothetical protein
MFPGRATRRRGDQRFGEAHYLAQQVKKDEG